MLVGIWTGWPLGAAFGVGGALYGAFVVERRDLVSARWWLAFALLSFLAAGIAFRIAVPLSAAKP